MVVTGEMAPMHSAGRWLERLGCGRDVGDCTDVECE